MVNQIEENNNQIGINKWFLMATGLIVLVLILLLTSFRGQVASDLNNISIPLQDTDIQIQAGPGLNGGTITNIGTISLNAPVCNQVNDKLQWNGSSFICVDEVTGTTTPTTPTTNTDNQTLFYNAGNLTISNGNTVFIPLGGGSAGVTSITAGAGLNGGVITTTGTVSLNAPTCALGETLTWNGAALSCVSVAGGGTLDDAYDFGGPGAGRTIFTDAGAVSLRTPGTIFPAITNDFEILGDGTNTTAGSGVSFSTLSFGGGEAYIQVFGPDAATNTTGSQASLIYQHDPINPLNDVFVIGIASSPFSNLSTLEFADAGYTSLNSGATLSLYANTTMNLQAQETISMFGTSSNSSPGQSPITIRGNSPSGYDIVDFCSGNIPVFGCIKLTGGGELDPNGFVDGYAGSLYVASQTGVTAANVLWANIGTAGVNNNQWVAIGDLGGGGGGTLDDAYDFGGPGAGRIINLDQGAVELRTSPSANVPLNERIAFKVVGDGSPGFSQTAGVGILRNINPAFPGAEATAFLFSNDIDNFNTTPGYGFLQYADAGGGNNVMIIGAGASGDDIYGTLFVSPAGISVSGGQALLGSGNGGRGASLGAGNGDGGGDGGAVNIYSGSNGASGNQTGDIFMSTATADFLSNGNTGQMNLSTGTAAGTGLSGSININTGYSNTFSGSINISTSNADTLTGTAGNISLNSGDAFTGGNIQLFGGDSADPFSSNGNIGFYAGTNTSSTIASANILISGSFQDNGGDINLNSSSSPGLNPASIFLAGTNTSTMQAASVNINAGSNSSFLGGNGGTVSIDAGNSFLGNAGAINISTGSTFSGAAGDFNLQTGIVSAGGGSGNMSLFTGSGQIGSGNILIGTGTATSVGNAGSIALSTGNGGPAGAGAGGNIQFSTGSSSVGSNDSAGAITFFTGSADLAGFGGNVLFDLGNSLDATAGSFSVLGGDALGTGQGGLISLTAGSGNLGGNVQISGGQSSDIAGLNGNVFINPGSNISSTLLPGYFQMYGVNSTSGGDVNLSSASYTNSSSATISLNGTNSSFEQSANINLNGAANFNAVFGTAGSINLYGGQANSGQGGNIQIISGGASSGNAGGVTISTGSVAGVGGTSGNINVNTGSSDGGTGSIQFVTGAPTGNATAGSIGFITGSGGVTGGFGGTITFTGGNGSAATNDGGGSLFFNSGSASNAGQAGDVTFQLGATVNGTGGTFNATGGAATGTGQGGDVFLLAGASTAGVGGTVVISTGNGGPAEGDMFFQIAGTTVIRVHQNRNIDLTGMVSSVNPSTQYLCLDATGRMIAQAGVCNVSSGKYKSNVQNLELGLAELMNLRPVSFTFDPTGASSLGFIAEEVAEVDSRLAFSRNGEIEGVNYELISALLTKAIQEQQTIIANIENEISTLNTIPQTENPDVDMINFTLADLRSQLDQFKLDYEEFKTQILNDVEYPGLEEIDVQNEETEQEIVAVSEFLSANFTGIVNFRDEVIFAANNLGAVTLLAQTSEVAVIFSKPLSSTPIVNVTLTTGADVGNYYVDEVNQFGFKIKLFTPSLADVTFNWIAFASN